jgi:ribosomal protein L37E
MLHTYCQDCGTKIEYAFKKPNFCTNCGQPLNAEASAQTPQVKQAPPSKREMIDDEDGTDIFEVPHIQSLEYEIEVSKSSFSMGDLFKHVESREEFSEAPQRKTRGRPRKSNGKTKKN